MTFTAALRQPAITAALVIFGPINGHILRICVEAVLAPTLRKGAS